jgi:hypothetical protein
MEVAMGSARPGMNAALSWSSGGALAAGIFGGDGQSVRFASLQGDPSLSSCNSFVPGRDDITFAAFTGSPPVTSGAAGSSQTLSWSIVEMHQDGTVDSPLSLPLPPVVNPTCAQQAATDAGYAVVWQDAQGSWLGSYDMASNRFLTSLFAAAADFGGADLQPPLAGVAQVGGGDLAVVLAEATSAEVWRLSGGARRPGALQLPSALGQMGAISSVPGVGGGLYVTYADYTAVDGGVGTAGQRYFLQATCP